MDENNSIVKVTGDNEGYVTFSCPYCHSDFKLQAGEVQSEDEPLIELFCPYCGLAKEKSSFYSEAILEQAKAQATNYMIEEINKKLGHIAHSINHHKGFLRMKFKPLETIAIKDLNENDTQEVAFSCDSCGRHVKVLYCAGESKIFCPYCGVDI